MIAETLDLDLDHVEDLGLQPDGTLVGAGERGQIYRIDVERGRAERIGSIRARALGVAVGDEGVVYVCSPGRRALVAWSPDGVRQVTAGTALDPMHHPNSMAMTTDGAFISDSGRWGAGDGRLYFHSAAGRTRVASREFPRFPNGVAVAHDGAHLWVVESEYGVSRAEIRANGSLGPRSVVAELPGYVPDGVTVTAGGDAVITCFQPNAVLLVEPSGRVEVIAEDRQGVHLLLPTNAVFAGESLERLVVANLGSRHLTILDLGLRGCPVAAGPRLPGIAVAA